MQLPDSADTLAKRAIAFTYFRSKSGGGARMEDLRGDFQLAGLAIPRADWLRKILTKDRRTKRTGTDTWMIPSDRFRDIESEFDLPSDGNSVPAAKTARSRAPKSAKKGGTFIDTRRLSELRKIKNASYDLTRLIKICNEINDNFSGRNYISTILLVRSLLDHVAPIFGFGTFAQIANNYAGTKSLKDSLQHLENSSRKIADGHLHTPIRKAEVLPTGTQVNFSQDIDVMLGEIVRLLK
jgi:hypothetical protein